MKFQWKWTYIMVLLPALCLIFCLIPGTVQFEYVTEEATVPVTCAILYGAPFDSVVGSYSYITGVILAALMGMGVLYIREEGDGMGKGYLIGSAAAAVLTLLPILTEQKAAWFPWVLLPLTLAAAFVVARKITEDKLEKKYDTSGSKK